MLLTIITVFIVFSILIIVHEAGHLVAAKRAGIRVTAFSLGMGKRLFGIKIGETDYRVSMLPFGGFCEMAGQELIDAEGKDYEFSSKSIGARFWVVVAGALTNYVFAFVLFSIIFMMGVPTLSNGVGQILKGYPAEKAGLESGDVILSINDNKVEYWDDVVGEIKKGSLTEKPLDLEVKRGEEVLEIFITPDISTVTNVFGQKISRSMIGIGPESKILEVSYGPLEAMYYGGKRLVELSAMTYKGIWLLITGGMPVKTSVSGPIGIARIMGQAAEAGIVPLLLIMAHVSMALAIFNLLPFPVLDGGHILFLGIEKLRGRPVSAKVQEGVSTVAIALLLTFVIFVSWQDILKTSLGDKILSILGRK